MSDVIRAWNNKGKSFDLTMFDQAFGPDEQIYNELKYAASEKIQLPESWRPRWRSLNEMYLSFMDPGGEIINFQFVHLTGRSVYVIQQMYFKQGNEKRELVFENNERDFFKFQPLEELPVPTLYTDGENIEMSADWHMGYGTEIIRKDLIEDIRVNVDKLSIDCHRNVFGRKKFSDSEEKGKTNIPNNIIADFGRRHRHALSWREQVLKRLRY